MTSETSVDVLAVMSHCQESADSMAKALPGHIGAEQYAREIRHARAAVAELIEAMKLIAECPPQKVMSLQAKVGAGDAIGWNFQVIAQRALSRLTPSESHGGGL